MAETLNFEVDGDGIAVVTIDLPNASMNVINETFQKEFAEAVERIVTDASIKGAVIAYLGLPVYAEAIATLEQGSLLERAGAFIMRPDLVSQAVAGELAQFIR